MSALAERVDKFFKITERGSTLRIELWAAVANFTANAYLLVLVPELLAAAGVKRSASLFGFVVATFVSSSIVGLVGNLPVAMGPGTGLEKVFLQLIDFNLVIRGSEYAKYYFILKGFADQFNSVLPMGPLDVG